MSKLATILAAAAATLAIASPSFAADKEYKARVVERNGQTLYCVKAPAATGSNIVQRVCRTQEEWAAAGAKVVPTEKSGRLAANAPQAVNQN